MSGFFQNILEWIFSWVGNYGWAVVIFTLLIRLVLLPLDIKSKKIMRAMQKVQPKVLALQKKYANDNTTNNITANKSGKHFLNVLIFFFMFFIFGHKVTKKMRISGDK